MAYDPEYFENPDEYYYYYQPGPNESTQPAPVASGPPWTPANPPPMDSARPGYYWRLNPATGEFEEVPTAPADTGPDNTDTGPGNTDTAPPPGGSYGGGTVGGGTLAALGTFGSVSPRATFSDVPEFNAPRFQAPAPFQYSGKAPDAFKAPTAADVANEPGFQFRLEQGRKALEQSAAGKGVLRTGGTLKNLVDYGQNFASNEYGNVYNRAANERDRKFNEYAFDYNKELGTYTTNHGVNRDVYDREFQALLAEYQPKLTGWQTNANADQRAAELLFGREWDQYALDEQNRLTREGWVFNNT